MKIFLNLVAKLFLGTGIGAQRFPWLFALYKKLNRPSFGKVKYIIPLGLSLKLKDDFGPSFFLKVKGEYEPLQTKLFMESIRKGDIVFDVGAHAGYYSLIAAKLIGKKGKVFAFEPNLESAAFLKENAKDNELKNIKIVKKAVSDKNGRLPFFIPYETSGDASLRKNKGKKVLVDSVSLDRFVSTKGVFPNILKVDVEGAEELVFAGESKLLKRKILRAVFVEVGSKESNVPFVLKKNGFSLFLIDEVERRKVRFNRRDFYRLLRRNGYVNLFACRKCKN